ncbi:MAG: hypothetical protein PHX44_00980 [Sulfurimonas sp.]|uniref:hypothetical protein n=1 Tax=Sulfurimonas sp. TaxID=2022749 RepID=UPI00261BCB86|nr:hypothetical protein [Sulfurimonas sp.]MDD2651609.1 hypothetical protein [Sulfurimonas sp.]MDD3451420.1 hypothetical protein [Sulfurimonas sp.]
MRSRDGNRHFTRRLCPIILLLLFPLALSAGEYLISYKYIVKDATLYNEALFISHSMKKCSGLPQSDLLLYSNGESDLKKVIAQNSAEFLEYIHKLGLHVAYSDATTNLQNSSTTTLTLRTTCFKVDFNDTFVTIVPLK